MRLSNDDFKDLIRNGILLSIDLIIRSDDGKILLGKRINMPAKGYWFVPGGRVLKNENFKDALHRICSSEVGNLKEGYYFRKLGMYNHIYPDNFFGDPDFNTHYIAIGIELFESDIEMKDSMTEQHDEVLYLSENEIMHNHQVHDNTKYYFIENPPNKFL